MLDETWDVLVSAIESGELPPWRAINLFAELDDREHRFFSLIVNNNISFDLRFDLASYLARVFPTAEERDHAINRLMHDRAIDSGLGVVGSLLAARYGDRVAFEKLIDDIPALTTQLVNHTLSLFGHHPGRTLAARAAELVATRPNTPEDIASIAGSAENGMRYIYEMDWGFGGGLRETQPHAGTPIWADLLTRWLDRNDLSDSQRMDVAGHAAKLGSERAKRELVDRVLAIEDPDDPRYDDGRGLGMTMRSAVDDTRRYNGQIPLDLAVRLVRAKRPNISYAGIAAIEAHGDRPALDLLLLLHSEATDWMDRSTLEATIEKLASKLSIFVRRRDRALEIAE